LTFLPNRYLGSDGNLRYVGPSNGSDQKGGVGIVFVKDVNGEWYTSSVCNDVWESVFIDAYFYSCVYIHEYIYTCVFHIYVMCLHTCLYLLSYMNCFQEIAIQHCESFGNYSRSTYRWPFYLASVTVVMISFSHTYTHADTQTHTHTHTHTRVYTRTHTRTHTRVHAHTHTHIHTQTIAFLLIWVLHDRWFVCESTSEERTRARTW